MSDGEAECIRDVEFSVAEIGMHHHFDHSSQLMFFSPSVSGHGAFDFEGRVFKNFALARDQAQ